MTATAELSCARLVLAISGARGSGKTTLLEAVIPALKAQGLQIGLVRLAGRGGDAARAVADCARFARTGCDVHFIGPPPVRKRGSEGPDDRSVGVVSNLADHHDLVLIESVAPVGFPTVWLESAARSSRRAAGGDIKAVLRWNERRVDALLSFLGTFLPGAWLDVPVLGGVLVGGRSSRLGTPKQLLEHAGLSLVERAVAALKPHVGSVVLLGRGPVPPGCKALPRLPDVPGVAGPLAGILAAMRWSPGAAWLFCPCDLPLVTAAAAGWVIAQRSPGRWMVIPRVSRRGVEPLFAMYEPQARAVLEELAARGVLAPRLAAAHKKAVVVGPPPRLRTSWHNVNSLEELESLSR